jgi:hypothetical protein
VLSFAQLRQQDDFPVGGSQVKITLIAKHHARSLDFSSLCSYPPWGKKFDLASLLRRMLRGQESSLGLLIALVFVGFTGFAVLAFFAIGGQTPTDRKEVAD